MAEFTVKTSRHCEIIDITEDVNRVLRHLHRIRPPYHRRDHDQ